MNKHIYIDMDGVLANFDKAARSLFGVERYWEIPKEERWEIIKSTPRFYETMEPLPDARKLLDGVRGTNSFTILTALARRVPTCSSEKIRWMRKWFSVPPEQVICVYEDKWPWAVNGDILVDDTKRHIDEWELAGGIGVHHSSTELTLSYLRSLNVI
jgi:5'(3')-deoxyribonucleotidase